MPSKRKTAFRVVVENSAPSQKRPAKSMAWASSILARLGTTSVADIGCGRLRNLETLERFFSEIILVDTTLQCSRVRDLVPRRPGIRLLTTCEFERCKTMVDAAFLVSVLHVIPNKQERKSLLDLTTRKVRRRGYVLVDVPSGEGYYRRKCASSNRYKDGWVMGTSPMRTFYKSYVANELDSFLTSGGHLELFQKVWFGKHLVRLMRKTR